MNAENLQSQITTPNLHVDAADGVTYRYRRFGIPNRSELPLLCLVTSAPPSTTGTRSGRYTRR